jgi:hypothetical protein
LTTRELDPLPRCLSIPPPPRLSSARFATAARLHVTCDLWISRLAHASRKRGQKWARIRRWSCLALICPCPTWNRLEPLTFRRPENRDESVSLFGGVVEQDGVVGALHRCRKILEASPVAPSDVALRDIMASRKNSVSDSSQVDLNIICPDVDQHDLETTNARIGHHSQIVLSGQRGFDREALMLADMLLRRRQSLTRGRNRKCCGRRRLQCSRDCVRI